MKKYLFILFFILVITQLLAQEYISINFTSNTNLDSLYVENITKETNLMINGSDTLHLIFTSTLINEDFLVEPTINIYPNPSSDVSYIQYICDKSNDITIEVCDISGNVILKRNIYLKENQHLFSISGLSTGIYLVKFGFESKTLTERLIITNKSSEKASFKYCGISEKYIPNYMVNTNEITAKKTAQNKSTKNIIEMDFDTGDQLVITGSAVGYIDSTFTISPTEDQSIELDLEECIPPTCPEVGIHSITQTQIIWNWSTSPYATGYKYNNINSYESAFDNGINTTYIQSGLNCSTEDTLFVWAYNDCGESEVLVLNEETETCPWYCGDTFTDSRDENIYQTVQIGSQCWMAENLKYLPSVDPPSEISQTSANYYVYDYFGTNIEEAKATTNYYNYGVLYNFTAAMYACPSGWQIASDYDWIILEMYLGIPHEEAITTGLRGTNQGSKLAGNSSLWSSGTLIEDPEFDSLGFSAVPGGNRGPSGGGFINESDYAFFWGIPGISSNFSHRGIYSTETKLFRGDSFEEVAGLSIRCIKD